MLRYRADIRTLAFVSIYFSLTAFTWVYFEQLSWYTITALVIACAQFSFFGAVITHNTIHCPIFKNRKMNILFQVILSLTYGHPVSSFVPGHNFSHHKYTQTDKDVMRTYKARFRWNFLNHALFRNVVSSDILKWEVRFALDMRKEKPAWFRQYMVEMAIVMGIKVALAVINWKLFILLNGYSTIRLSCKEVIVKSISTCFEC